MIASALLHCNALFYTLGYHHAPGTGHKPCSTATNVAQCLIGRSNVVQLYAWLSQVEREYNREQTKAAQKADKAAAKAQRDR